MDWFLFDNGFRHERVKKRGILEKNESGKFDIQFECFQCMLKFVLKFVFSRVAQFSQQILCLWYINSRKSYSETA